MSEFGSETSRRTVRHYAGRAEAFWEGTRDHDVTQNRQALIRHLHGDGPHHILDFGCGPGRDVRAFSKAGYEVTGLDGCATFCDMARDYSGCRILHQDFLALDLRKESFDGIFANASIFHVPTEHLARVLLQLHTALKPHGVLFCSNPRGPDEEGWNGERYSAYHSLESWRRRLVAANFDYLEHYYRPPGLPREQQPWLASLWRKASGPEIKGGESA